MVVAAAAVNSRAAVLRPWARQPPPAGIRPRRLASMWTSSPGRLVWMRRTTRPVGRCNQARRFRPRRHSTRCTVEGACPTMPPMRAGPSLRAVRSCTIRRSTRRWGLMRARTRPARTVPQAGVPSALPARPPLVDGLARHVELRRDLTDRKPDDHQLDEFATRSQREPGISVNVHEGLLERVRAFGSSTPTPGGPPYWWTRMSTTSVVITTSGRCRCARVSTARVAGTHTARGAAEPTWMRARELPGRRIDRVHLGVEPTGHPQHRAVGRHATHVRAAVRDHPQPDHRMVSDVEERHRSRVAVRHVHELRVAARVEPVRAHARRHEAGHRERIAVDGIDTATA